MQKSNSNSAKENSKATKNNDLGGASQFMRGTAPKNVADAKKLAGRLISHFMKGRVSDSKAKTLMYLLNSFVAMHRDHEFEKRIEELEKLMEKEN